MAKAKSGKSAGAKKPRHIFYTPVGVARFPDILKPKRYIKRTKEWVIDYDKGHYMAQLILPRADAEPLIEKLQAILDKYVEAQIAEDDSFEAYTVRPVVEDEEDDDGNPTGNVIFKFKQAAKITTGSGEEIEKTVKIVDSANVKFKPKQVWGGSRMAVKFEASPYATDLDDSIGLSLRLYAVQIVELVDSGAEDTSGFDKYDDGYKASEADDDDEPPFDPDEDDDAEDDDASRDGKSYNF